jgi:transposase, IS5 family
MLLRDNETDVCADVDYQGNETFCKIGVVIWHVTIRAGMRIKRNLTDRLDAMYGLIERQKAGVRALVEHPFRFIKCRLGYTKTRYCGLVKRTPQMTALFALGNRWMARGAMRQA